MPSTNVQTFVIFEVISKHVPRLPTSIDIYHMKVERIL